MILTISGNRRHGKGELGKRISVHTGVPVIHFADDLKAMTAQIWGFTVADLNDTVKKEEPLPTPVKMDAFLPQMEEATGLKLVSAGLIAPTRRKVLQFFGTDYVRTADYFYWISRTFATAKRLGGDAIIADGRFENETRLTQQAGGRVVNIFREGMEMPDDHTSEQISEVYDYRFVVPYDGIDRIEEAAKMLSGLFPVQDEGVSLLGRPLLVGRKAKNHA